MTKPILFILPLLLFVSAAEAQITFTSPKANAKWPRGSVQTITWTADSSAPTRISLHLLHQSGNAWIDQPFLDTLSSIERATYTVASNAEMADNYQLEATTDDIDMNLLGSVTPISIVAANTGIAGGSNPFVSLSAFPNPAEDACTISFNVPSATDATLSITSLSGQQVLSMPLGSLIGGNCKAGFSTASLPNGIYLCRVSMKEGLSTIKLIVLH
jgi:hypothetical protein